MGFLLVAALMLGSLAAIFIVSERRFKQAGYDRRSTPPTSSPAHRFETGASGTLKGGARIRWSNATWPLATLTVDSDWARLTSMVGTVWISRCAVTAVQVVHGLMGPGVLFRNPEGAYDGVIFWTFSSNEVKRMFAMFGWPVSD